MCAFMVIVLKMGAKEAHNKFSPYQLKPFCDASQKQYKWYSCTVLHCLEGLEAALKFGWYDFAKFDEAEYDYYS